MLSKLQSLSGIVKILQLQSRLFRRNYLCISEEVKRGLQQNGPIVALESTIITHGMPFPTNLNTALKLEQIVRQNNAIPATIAVLNGKAHIGLTKEQLEHVASKDAKFIKISRRDLPYALSKGITGGTTVAATMALAHRAGIRVFATGGIGGVHRGGENSLDISADLIELSRTPMAIISAGIKSILDIGRTLEYLETHGVCVATFGQNKNFPAFFTPDSGFKAPCYVESIAAAAQLIVSRDELNLESGILFAVPISASAAADGEATEQAILKGLQEAKEANVKGRDVTPFLLSRIGEISGGASLKANIALVENNVQVGSLIAVELNKSGKKIDPVNHQEKIRQKTSVSNVPDISPNPVSFSPSTKRRPVVIGGSALDVNITHTNSPLKIDGSTQPGKVTLSSGGVGRNLADCLARLGADPFFISAVGRDNNGKILLDKMKHMDISGVNVLDSATAVFAVLLDPSGDCLYVLGDTGIHNHISASQVKQHMDTILKAPIVVLDGNISMDTMGFVIKLCAEHNIPVWFEPTDTTRAHKPFTCENWNKAVWFASPNLNELRAMRSAICGEPMKPIVPKELSSSTNLVEECVELALPIVQHIPTLLVTLGSLGCVLLTRHRISKPFGMPSTSSTAEKTPIQIIHYLPPKPSSVVSVSGSGDCFASGVISAFVEGLNADDCIRTGQTAAMMSLASRHAVPDVIRQATIRSQLADANQFPELRIIRM